MNTKEKNNMPTGAYITVKRNAEGKVDVYVGGKPATTYHGQPIGGIEFIKECFEWMQGKNPDIEEFHIGAFATRGYEWGKTGNPSSGFGPHAWCRVKRKNGTSSWVFRDTDGSETLCAGNCAFDCAYSVRISEDFCNAVFQNKQQNNDMPTDAYITTDETGMRTDAYITVKRNAEGEVDVYVGGKPATTYYGQDICDIPRIKKCFEWMQGKNPDIEEFHIGAFETGCAVRGKTGNPLSVFGPHAWCRVKFKKDEKYGSWVFYYKHISAAFCAVYCASDFADYVRNDADFYAAVFNAPIEKPTVGINGRDLAHTNNIDETGRPTDAYITVKRNEQGKVDIYVGGKPATTYLGQPICGIKYIKKYFEWMQGKYPDIEEFHIGAFATRGFRPGQTGNPSSDFGSSSWCRVKCKNGTSSWVFHATDGSETLCAGNCAVDCAINVRYDADFCNAVFNAPIDKTSQPGEKTTGSGQGVGLELGQKSQQTKMNNMDKTGMPTDAYITVKCNEKGEVEIYVGGEPARTYHGQPICGIKLIKKCFEWMQGKYPDIEEFHIGAFATGGFRPGQTGNPSSGFGPHAWCRVKRKNGTSSWVFHATDGSETLCAGHCASDCAVNVRYDTDFCNAVFQNKQQNYDMPTDAYITVKRNEKGEVEIYVGGKPATTYRGNDIYDIELIKKHFAWIQEENPDIEEFHIGAFATGGFRPGETGNPSSVFGPSSWCRVKRKNGTSSWVFHDTYGSAADCASNCANDCVDSCASRYACSNINLPVFRAAVFNAPIEKPTVGINGRDLAHTNNIDETGRPTDAYITVKRNEKGEIDVYVGGKPATEYHCAPIYGIEDIKEVFAWMQKVNPDIEEFHIGAFATRGDKMGQFGNPSSDFGPHAWCRVKYKNVGYGFWIFNYTLRSAVYCANACLSGYSNNVREYADFRTALLHAPIDKTLQPGKTTGSAQGVMLGTNQHTK